MFVLSILGELTRWLRENLDIPKALTDKQLIEVAKNWWRISKKTAKLDKPLKYSSMLVDGRQVYDKFILGVFAMNPSVLIFDVCTFSLDHKGVKGWAPLLARPIVTHPTANRYYHLLLAINRDGVKAACLTKASVTAQDTAYFLISMLEKLGNVTCISLDNGPANTPKLIGKVAGLFGLNLVYNVASNPRKNPIECLFGVYKNEIRRQMIRRSNMVPADISLLLASVSRDTVRATIARTIHNIT